MAVDIATADNYFNTEVLHNQAWTDATTDMKNRSLKNAENTLYQVFNNFDKADNPIPEKAIFEQSLFILQKDDTILKAQHGVGQVSVQGISISIAGGNFEISKVANRIISIANGGTGSGVRVGRYR